VFLCQFGAVRGEKGVCFGGHKEVFVLGKAERLP
jgi:hypothetical protein